MKRRSSRFDGLGFSSVSAEKNVRLMLRSAAARAYSALTMWLALPSPSGSPTTSLVPTSRMISSAIASGSENIFGIKFRAQARCGIASARNRPQPRSSYSVFVR